jgi:hypothetical protein
MHPRTHTHTRTCSDDDLADLRDQQRGLGARWHAVVHYAQHVSECVVCMCMYAHTCAADDRTTQMAAQLARREGAARAHAAAADWPVVLG